MKKLLLAAFVVFAYIIYSLHQRDQGGGAVIAPTPTAVSQASPNSGSASNTNTTAGSYKDGQYTGSVADAYYGNVQVKATIQGGKLTDVTFLQYPSDRSTSIRINTQAMPYLKQEAITAQSANVDAVSGATYTSQAFIQSLTSALSGAHS